MLKFKIVRSRYDSQRSIEGEMQQVEGIFVGSPILWNHPADNVISDGCRCPYAIRCNPMKHIFVQKG